MRSFAFQFRPASKDLLHVDGCLAQGLLLEVHVDVGGGLVVGVADDVVDLGLAFAGVAVDELLKLGGGDGLHVLHAEGRNQMLHEAGFVVGPACIRDERLLLQLVPLPGIFVELQIPRDLPPEDVVLPDGLLDVFQLSAGRCSTQTDFSFPPFILINDCNVFLSLL